MCCSSLVCVCVCMHVTLRLRNVIHTNLFAPLRHPSIKPNDNIAPENNNRKLPAPRSSGSVHTNRTRCGCRAGKFARAPCAAAPRRARTRARTHINVNARRVRCRTNTANQHSCANMRITHIHAHCTHSPHLTPSSAHLTCSLACAPHRIRYPKIVCRKTRSSVENPHARSALAISTISVVHNERNAHAFHPLTASEGSSQQQRLRSQCALR